MNGKFNWKITNPHQQYEQLQEERNLKIKHNSLQGKIVYLTGATGTIGAEIAKGVVRAGATLIFTARDPQKAQNLMEELWQIRGSTFGISSQIVDLTSAPAIMQSVQRVTQEYKHLDVLINNAAAVYPTMTTVTNPYGRGTKTVDVEATFAVNVMSYFLLMNGFRPLLRESRGRIINMGAKFAGGLDLNDLQFERRRYIAKDAYQNSKQAVRMLSAHAGSLFEPDDIDVHAIFPCLVPSPLSHALGAVAYWSGEQGAAGPLHLAELSKQKLGQNGGWWEAQQSHVTSCETGLPKQGEAWHSVYRQQCRFSNDRLGCQQLWEYMEGFLPPVQKVKKGRFR